MINTWNNLEFNAVNEFVKFVQTDVHDFHANPTVTFLEFNNKRCYKTNKPHTCQVDRFRSNLMANKHLYICTFIINVQGVLGLCEFHYCDLSKHSIILGLSPRYIVTTRISAVLTTLVQKKPSFGHFNSTRNIFDNISTEKP